jgi:DNA repair photolyase
MLAPQLPQSTRLASTDGACPTALRPVVVHKGRGAVSNPPGRFERLARSAQWDACEHTADEPGVGASGALAPPATEVRAETVRSLIQTNDSPDIPFDLSINPYRGCEHGCVYCYARPLHAYLGLSPGLDFETRLVAKVNAAAVLRQELAARAYRCRPINLGSVTDAYQPCERAWGITRQVLQVLAECRHPLTIITKGVTVERDIDLLAPMAAQGLVAVTVTLVTLDAALARKLEPRAPSPARRLRMIERLAGAGIPVGVSVAPIIPFINDDIEQVLQAARRAGAACSAMQAQYVMLRLPWELEQVFGDWLAHHYPQRAQRVLRRLQDLRGRDAAGAARVNDPRFFARMRGEGIWADLFGQRFERACRSLGMRRERLQLDCSRFDPALLGGQQRLF